MSDVDVVGAVDAVDDANHDIKYSLHDSDDDWDDDSDLDDDDDWDDDSDLDDDDDWDDDSDLDDDDDWDDDSDLDGDDDWDDDLEDIDYDSVNYYATGSYGTKYGSSSSVTCIPKSIAKTLSYPLAANALYESSKDDLNDTDSDDTNDTDDSEEINESVDLDYSDIAYGSASAPESLYAPGAESEFSNGQDSSNDSDFNHKVGNPLFVLILALLSLIIIPFNRR